MKPKVLTILQDKRPIRSIYFTGYPHESWTVGEFGVTSIEPYVEPFQQGEMIWLVVYIHSQLVQRVPAGQVAISYDLIELDNEKPRCPVSVL